MKKFISIALIGFICSLCSCSGGGSSSEETLSEEELAQIASDLLVDGYELTEDSHSALGFEKEPPKKLTIGLDLAWIANGLEASGTILNINLDSIEQYIEHVSIPFEADVLVASVSNPLFDDDVEFVYCYDEDGASYACMVTPEQISWWKSWWNENRDAILSSLKKEGFDVRAITPADEQMVRLMTLIGSKSPKFVVRCINHEFEGKPHRIFSMQKKSE